MIEKREVYKELKKHKVFGKYCLAVSQAFAMGMDYKYLPRDRYEVYYETVLGNRNKNDLNNFIKDVKTWQIPSNNIKILA